MQCRNYLLKQVGIGPQFQMSIPEYLLKEIGIHPQFWKSIPDFISKVMELTSGIEDQFLPLLEGNSGIAFQMLEVNSSL